jgi:hypothetical protein
MNPLQSVDQRRCALNIAMMVSLLGIAAPSFAGLNYSTLPDAAIWNGTPTFVTTTTPQASMTVNQQVTITDSGITQTQTFKTGASGFLLDKISIYSGGKGGGTARLNIYPDPVGGENVDGFVNTSFSTDLLNGGAGLEFIFNGSPGAQYVQLDLTGPDEITLAPNQQYAVEVDVISGQWSWLRSAAPGSYLDGNIYQAATEMNFNGTPPANNRGERFQVGGTPDRDGGMALYQQDGMIVSNQPDATAWPGAPVHTTTGASNLQTAFDTVVALDPGGALTHTFTPDTTFKLDKFMIRAAGAPTTGELYLYQEPVGGTESDGFVNVAFVAGTPLAALPFTFDGTATRTLLEFDLLGNNEITLQAGVKYAIDLRNTGSGTMFWTRGDTNDYSGGNIYTQANAAGDTQRFDVVGEGRRDGALALYAPPAGIPGDYNNSGAVDAADYVLWRNGGPLQNEVADVGTVSPQDYTEWRARFGNASAGAGLGAGEVPEPAAWSLTLAAMSVLALRRTKK